MMPPPAAEIWSRAPSCAAWAMPQPQLHPRRFASATPGLRGPPRGEEEPHVQPGRRHEGAPGGVIAARPLTSRAALAETYRGEESVRYSLALPRAGGPVFFCPSLQAGQRPGDC